MMKIKVFLSILLLTVSYSVFAQDKIFAEYSPAVDSAFLRIDIFDLLGDGVSIDQPSSLLDAHRAYCVSNEDREIVGYRVRIFFDNSRDARTKANDVMSAFMAQFPLIPAYLDYRNPYFKVTVGDFRTKSDATVFQNSLRRQYPNCFIVKELMRFPEL